VAVLLIPFARLLSRTEVENCHFRLLYSNSRAYIQRNDNNIHVIYTSLKSPF